MKKCTSNPVLVYNIKTGDKKMFSCIDEAAIVLGVTRRTLYYRLNDGKCFCKGKYVIETCENYCRDVLEVIKELLNEVPVNETVNKIDLIIDDAIKMLDY